MSHKSHSHNDINKWCNDRSNLSNNNDWCPGCSNQNFCNNSNDCSNINDNNDWCPGCSNHWCNDWFDCSNDRD